MLSSVCCLQLWEGREHGGGAKRATWGRCTCASWSSRLRAFLTPLFVIFWGGRPPAVPRMVISKGVHAAPSGGVPSFLWQGSCREELPHCSTRYSHCHTKKMEQRHAISLQLPNGSVL